VSHLIQIEVSEDQWRICALMAEGSRSSVETVVQTLFSKGLRDTGEAMIRLLCPDDRKVEVVREGAIGLKHAGGGLRS
jgi:hypothetical protein